MNDSEKLFGELLVDRGVAKPEQVRECLALREELLTRSVSPIPNLGELLLEKGFIASEAYWQVISIRAELNGERTDPPEETIQALLDVIGGEGSDQDEPPEEVSLPPEVVKAYTKKKNRFGKYVRMSKLGAGGMGEVWKAWDTELGRWAALKFLKSAEPDDLLRFRREAQTAGQVDHPHIAAIYEVGEKSGMPYIAMQYVEGETLSSFLRNDIREISMETYGQAALFAVEETSPVVVAVPAAGEWEGLALDRANLGTPGMIAIETGKIHGHAPGLCLDEGSVRRALDDWRRLCLSNRLQWGLLTERLHRIKRRQRMVAMGESWSVPPSPESMGNDGVRRPHLSN